MTYVPSEEPRGVPPGPPAPGSPEASASPYPAPGQQGPPVQGVRNGLGVAALVLGIISLLFMIFLPPVGVILGILALIFGIIGVRRAGRGEATNRGQALAGAITGGIGLVISVALVAILGAFVFTHRTQINQYTQCLQNAHTQHARDVCNQQFRNSINR